MYLVLLIFSFLAAFVAAVSEEILVEMLKQLRGACHPQFPGLSEDLLNQVQDGYEPEVPPTDLKVMCFEKMNNAGEQFGLLSVLFEMLLRFHGSDHKKGGDKPK